MSSSGKTAKVSTNGPGYWGSRYSAGTEATRITKPKPTT